jgi:hypothetical protein
MMKDLYLGPSSKTVEGMDAVARLITSGRANPAELCKFKAATEIIHLDEFAAESLIAGGPWKTGAVQIRMPRTLAKKDKELTEQDTPQFEVSGIQYRSLVDVIMSKFKDLATAKSLVPSPFTEWWCPPGATTPIRIYGEAYSSDIAIKLLDEVKKLPPPKDHLDIESTIVLLMLRSDATHLASFGTASLWPLYLFFGNLSKYDSPKSSESPACHLAYLPKV